MIKFTAKLIDVASFSQLMANEYGYEVTEIFDLMYEYESFDLIYNSIQYARRNNISDLKRACEIMYKSEALN